MPRAAWLVAAAVAAHASADEAGPNPFARPVASHDEPRTFATAASPAFVLRATMKAGDASMVNIDGAILRIGEEIDGYRLVAVGEGTAVFTRGEIPYVLAIVEEEQP